MATDANAPAGWHEGRPNERPSPLQPAHRWRHLLVVLLAVVGVATLWFGLMVGSVDVFVPSTWGTAPHTWNCGSAFSPPDPSDNLDIYFGGTDPGTCPDQTPTRVRALTLMSLGVISLGIGAWLAALDSRRRRAARTWTIANGSSGPLRGAEEVGDWFLYWCVVPFVLSAAAPWGWAMLVAEGPFVLLLALSGVLWIAGAVGLVLGMRRFAPERAAHAATARLWVLTSVTLGALATIAISGLALFTWMAILFVSGASSGL